MGCHASIHVRPICSRVVSPMDMYTGLRLCSSGACALDYRGIPTWVHAAALGVHAVLLPRDETGSLRRCLVSFGRLVWPRACNVATSSAVCSPGHAVMHLLPAILNAPWCHIVPMRLWAPMCFRNAAFLRDSRIRLCR